MTKPMFMLQDDFSYMTSPVIFKRFLMPDLEECRQSLDDPFFHLDGQDRIRCLNQPLSIENLCCGQWIEGAGAPPVKERLDLLQRIRDGGRLWQVYASVGGARKIIDELFGKSIAFVISGEMTREEAAPSFEGLTRG